MPDEIHVWHLRLEYHPVDLQNYLLLLSPDEIARAQRFRYDSDRNEFIVGRGSLRSLLALYLDVAPDALRFSYSAFGRPSVVRHKSEPKLDFNISHSGG